MDRLDRYTCDEALRRLEEYLDRELTPQEMGKVEAHLESCAPCTSRFRYEASLLNGIRARLQRTPLPPDLLSKIHRMLDDAAGP